MPKQKETLEKKLASSQKKKFPTPFQKLLIALITIVVLIIINQQVQQGKKLPETNFFQTNQNNQSQTIKNVIYVGSEFSLPPSFPIFKINQKDKEGLVDFFVKKYNLLKHANVDDLYINDKYFLNVDKQNGEYYAFSLHQPLNILPFGVKQDQALSVADQIIQEFFPDSHLIAQQNEIIYLKGGYMIEQTTKEEASYIQIPYSYNLNNLPVFYQKDTQYPFLLTLSSEYELVKLEFSPLFLEFEETNNFNSLDLKKVLENVNQKQKSIIVDSFSQDEVPISAKDVVSGKLISYQLEYRIDQNNQIAFPALNFSGVFKNSQDEEFEGKLITPATK